MLLTTEQYNTILKKNTIPLNYNKKIIFELPKNSIVDLRQLMIEI